LATEAYLDSLGPGQGVNSVLKTSHNFAVEGQFQTAVVEAAGIFVDYALEVITSTEEVASVFNRSATFGFTSVFFSASASAEFINRSRFSRYRTYVVARCRVEFADTRLVDIRFKPEVRDEARKLTRDEFERLYGTEFLMGIKTGGEYYGVIEVESTTTEQQQQIAVAVSAAGWGAKASVSVSKQLEEKTANMAKRVFAIRHGGTANVPNPQTADEIIFQAVNFPAIAAAAPRIMLGVYQPYDQFFKIDFAEGEGEFKSDKRRGDLQSLGRRYVRLKGLRNDFQFVLDHYNDYLLGKGVTFKVGDTPLRGRSLAKVPAAELQLRVEAEVSVDQRPQSKEITASAITAELAVIEERLEQVTLVADLCKNGKPYVLPEQYVGQIGLPHLAGENTELEMLKRHAVPSGTIAMWSGLADSVPDGWVLCDGKSGTPNLTDRFIRGAGEKGDPAPFTSGESEEHQHHIDPPAFTTQTSDAGAHSHGMPSGWYSRSLGGGPFSSVDTLAQDVASSRVQTDGNHHHDINIDIGDFLSRSASTGKPRWFALCFIMKT
jgi:hypothetical protein